MAVECVVDAQNLTQYIRLLAADLGDELIEQRTRAGDAYELRAIDRGNLELSVEFFKVVPHAPGGEPDRGHAALPPCPLLQPAAVIDDIHGLRQRERAGNVRRGDFADAVPDHRLGPDAPRRQPLGKRHLQREYRRLGDDGLVDARAILRSRQLVEQRPSGPLREELVAALDGLSKQRILPQQPAPHAPPLGALPGEHECEPPAACSATRYHGVGRLAGGNRAQRAHRRLGGLRRHDQSMIEMGASQRQGSRDVGERTGTRLEPVRELGTRGRQRGLARRRYRNQRRPPIR